MNVTEGIRTLFCPSLVDTFGMFYFQWCSINVAWNSINGKFISWFRTSKRKLINRFFLLLLGNSLIFNCSGLLFWQPYTCSSPVLTMIDHVIFFQKWDQNLFQMINMHGRNFWCKMPFYSFCLTKGFVQLPKIIL